MLTGIKYFFLFFFISACLIVKAQEQLSFTLEPRLSITKSISDKWALNFQGTTFQTIAERKEGEWTDYFYVYTQGQLFVHFKPLYFLETSLGYRLRVFSSKTGNFNEHRIMQQFKFKQPQEHYNIGHRLRIEERLRRKNSELRLRYRISFDFPLNGPGIDVHEHYIDLNNEVLYSIQSSKQDIENRLGIVWGYLISENQKIAWEVEYQLNDIIHAWNSTEFYSKITYYLDL